MLSLVFQFLFCLMLPIYGSKEINNLCIKSVLVAYRLHFWVLYSRKRLKSLFLASSVNWSMGRRVDFMRFYRTLAPIFYARMKAYNIKNRDLRKSWLFLMHML